jgi:flagellar hook assembly protein FlgD
LSAPGPVRVALYDVAGRRVALLEDGYRETGEHTLVWNGRDDAGRRVSPGVYVARLEAGTFSAAAKVVVLK